MMIVYVSRIKLIRSDVVLIAGPRLKTWLPAADAPLLLTTQPRRVARQRLLIHAKYRGCAIVGINLKMPSSVHHVSDTGLSTDTYGNAVWFIRANRPTAPTCRCADGDSRAAVGVPVPKSLTA
jgi:hypothetical protein